MRTVNDRESRILNALPIATQEGKRAFRKFRRVRTENKDDFISIATLILIRATDYCLRKGWDNSEAWLRVQIRREINRYVERSDDDIHFRIKEYLLEKDLSTPESLIVAHEVAYKRSLKRNGNGTLTRDALNYARCFFTTR